jgi:ATP:ADP antiporter, AAA family
MSTTTDAPPSRHTWLDRLFQLFSEVRPGEAAGTLLLGVNVFLLLGSYYLLKTIREALILGESGAEVKSYAAAGQALLLLLVIPVYGMLGSKVHRMRLILIANGFFIACLVVFYVLGKAGVREGVAYYLWLGIYNNFVVAQFWAFANDIHSEEEGKRLFPIIGIGMSLGAWVGSVAAGKLIKGVGIYEVMLIGGAVLGVCTAMTFWSNSRAVAQSRHQRAVSAKPLGAEGGFHLIFSQRYLLLIAVMILLLNVVNSTGEFLLGKLVTMDAAGLVDENARKQFIGAFYSDFYGYVNLLGFLLQTFVASRVFKYLGVRGAIFILPVIAFGAYGLLLVYPVLAVVRFAKILENATDYSLMNTSRQALYLLTSREAKYKAKAAIDTFVVRTGDMLQAGVVFAGTAAGLTLTGFAGVTLAVVVAWLAVTGLIFVEHQRLESAAREVGEIR